MSWCSGSTGEIVQVVQVGSCLIGKLRNNSPHYPSYPAFVYSTSLCMCHAVDKHSSCLRAPTPGETVTRQAWEWEPGSWHPHFNALGYGLWPWTNHVTSMGLRIFPWKLGFWTRWSWGVFPGTFHITGFYDGPCTKVLHDEIVNTGKIQIVRVRNPCKEQCNCGS